MAALRNCLKHDLISQRKLKTALVVMSFKIIISFKGGNINMLKHLCMQHEFKSRNTMYLTFISVIAFHPAACLLPWVNFTLLYKDIAANWQI